MTEETGFPVDVVVKGLSACMSCSLFYFAGVIVQAEKRLSESICREYAEAIAEADGNEVFAAGFIDESGLVAKIQICARGHDTSVPLTKSASACSAIMHNHPSGNLQPSDADLEAASRAAENGQGFYIVDNSVTKIYVVVEPIKPRKLKKLDVQSVSGLLAAGGALDAISDNYEERPSQIALVKSITHVFNESMIGVFEAGTGVGKSFAYLLPAMLWAANNKERVIISTGTINLQQQLIEKDIPLAEKIIGKKVKAVLMKGRQNYICKRRLADASKETERDLFDEDAGQFDSILSWNETTETGSRSDLPFSPVESVWTRINSESDGCMGMRCLYHESCYVMKIRKEAADANIIVVNHHLLFADLEARLSGVSFDDTAVLPPFKRIIFDEAHGMEHAATSFFSEQIHRFKINKQLNLLYRVRRGAAAGHLFTLEALSSRSDKAAEVMGAIETIKDDLNTLEEEALLLLPYEFTWRLCSKTASDAAALLASMEKLRTSLSVLAGLFRSIIAGIPDKDADMPAVWETKQILSRLESCGSVCQYFTEWTERSDQVFWIDKVRYRSKKGDVIYPRFYVTPLDIAPKMLKGVFEPLDTVVCASATLKTGKSFDYWIHRTGACFVDSERLLCNEFASPFPYKQNLLLAVPSDIPLPDNPQYRLSVENAVNALIAAAGGRTLVLFTSYESLVSACENARTALAPLGIHVMRQGDDDRFRLLETFKKDTASVLFATDSFWEGVDVPGDSLSQVIIAKLPFSVPSDPVFAARSEAVIARGGNPFMELSVPEAVIRFRQGFGRLIRRSTDRGAVVVLDRRIVEKRYGSIFLASIPETKFLCASLSEITVKVENFLS